jgi:DNA-binding protein HU-beta
MSKLEFIATVAETADVPAPDAKRMVDTVIGALAQEIAALEDQEKLSIQGFGYFAISTRAPRKGRNPQTGKEIDIPAARAVRFKPASALKEAISGRRR